MMDEILMNDGTQIETRDLMTQLEAGKPLCNSVVPSGSFSALPMPDEMATGVRAVNVCYGDLSEDEKAVEPETVAKVGRCPIWNKLVRKITDAKGRCIYAWICMDENKKKKIVVYQEYRDGTFSGKIEMSKADVLAAAAGAVWEKPMQKHIDKFLVEAGLAYFEISNGELDERLCIGDLIQMLASEISSVPVYNNDILEMEREELYREFVGTVQCLISQFMIGFESYYPITKDDLEYVASSIGLKPTQFLKKLIQFDMLYLTPSSRGYQTNVRFRDDMFGSYTEWRYCIWRDKELEKRMAEEREESRRILSMNRA